MSLKSLLFRKELLQWYRPGRRPMPWKGETDPYRIWLSEIILQQTRVEQGWSYYQKFTEHYPTVHDLAKAPLDEVLKHWEGLGYYSRARNLHFTARFISKELGGNFPDTYNGLLKLKGVGPYTAAAVGSFAYGLPLAVVDGNVTRILSRYFGLNEDPGSNAGKKIFANYATECLDHQEPGKYNQAIMDFGALQCTPGQPNCQQCPMRLECVAFRQNKVDDYPKKTEKKPRRKRFFHYVVLRNNNRILIRQRDGQDIWKNLYELPMMETNEPGKNVNVEEVLPEIDKTRINIIEEGRNYKQTLSHQVIHATFKVVDLPGDWEQTNEKGEWVSLERLSEYAFPRMIRLYLDDNQLSLKLTQKSES